MKFIVICILVLMAGCSSTSPLNNVEKTKSLEICLFTGTPPADLAYTKLKKVKLGKGSYGSVVDILPDFAYQAHKLEADAIMNYAGTQRFGFWPWRIIRPVARGQAIKWDADVKPDCAQVGGTTIASVINTRKAPQ